MKILQSCYLIILLLISFHFSKKTSNFNTIRKTNGYSYSCNNCSLNQYNLTCNCLNQYGSNQQTTINLNSYFSNNTGQLQRGGTSFFQTCGGCSLNNQNSNNGYFNLSCYCKKGSDYDYTEMNSSVSLDQWINNMNGVLNIIPN